MIYYDVIPRTLIGTVFVAATSRGLCAVLLGNRRSKGFEAKLARMFPGETLEKNPSRVGAYRKQIEEYFEGRRTRFELPVDLSRVRSPFRRRVLRKLQSLPLGRVTSYGELAARAGSPGAARAVGSTMASNPVSVVIPCHRVVAASGGLGGFSGGLSMKRRLLAHEGVRATRSGLLRARDG